METAMGRFDRFELPRFQTEVNVPGYDVNKSVISARKLQQQRRKQGSHNTSSSPALAPAHMTIGEPAKLPPPSNNSKDIQCHDFKIEL
jgi:hypothetical protein